MAGPCRFSFGTRSGAGQWSFDGSYLLLTPEAGAPIPLALQEIRGISGDGYTITLAAPEVELVLSRLGAGGPTLLEELRRLWLVARAEVLRLGGSGEGKPFYGWVTGLDVRPTAPEPFWALLFEDVLVIARDGRDVEPLFLALFGSVEFDDPSYAVSVRQWPGHEVTFSKMAGQTAEFLKGLRANRAVLAKEAAGTLAAAIPKVSAGGRGTLSGMWLPGRLMESAAMEAVCRGFEASLRGEWLERLVRRDEGRYLLDWAASGSSWLGCTREKATEADAGDAEQPLWLLCGKKGIWFLEALSIEDRATYCFAGGDEMPALVSRLLCAPQFSKEALYLPLEELTGDDAELAIPAQFLGFLVALRAGYRDRIIHQSPEGWRKDVERLSRPGD